MSKPCERINGAADIERAGIMRNQDIEESIHKSMEPAFGFEPKTSPIAIGVLRKEGEWSWRIEEANGKGC